MMLGPVVTTKKLPKKARYGKTEGRALVGLIVFVTALRCAEPEAQATKATMGRCMSTTKR